MTNFASAFRALAHGTLNWDAQLDADMLDLEGRLKDTGWVTSGSSNVVAASGWTLNAFAFRVVNFVATLDVTVTKTTAATATASAAGVLTPTPVVTFPGGSALIPGQSNGLFKSVGSASTAAATGYARTTDVVIAELAPSSSIPVGGVLDLKGVFLL